MDDVDWEKLHEMFFGGEFYPIPCAACGEQMRREGMTAIYPFEGMICAECAEKYPNGPEYG